MAQKLPKIAQKWPKIVKMAQKWPKMAQKLAPAEKIAQIYLQHLQLFASLPAPRTAFITRRALLRSGGACPDPFVPASWQCLYHGTLPPSLSCELAGRGKVLMTNNLPSPVGQGMLADPAPEGSLSSLVLVRPPRSLLLDFLSRDFFASYLQETTWRLINH